MRADVDFDAFGRGLTRLVDAIPSAKAMQPAQIASWFDLLSDLDARDVERALHELALENDGFMPSVGQIRARVLGDPKGKALRAWDRMLQAIRVFGSYVSVSFQDPVLHTVIEGMGGWAELWKLPTDPGELSFRQRDFVGHYRAYERALPGPAPDHLAGQCEIENQERGSWQRGHEYRDQVLILDESGTTVAAKIALPGRSSGLRSLPGGQEDGADSVPEGPEALKELKERSMQRILRLVGGQDRREGAPEAPARVDEPVPPSGGL